ncbi:glycoside-pentoside-hexuronide (GPH):cation symporter [Lentilactobacillus hilgardii]|uniref:glycoside-pentoside-hexuronide (GPH):cation symporter n=1 Tax=Lentilactobacillus hilgardii TaxID=1588 RepID=UPI0021A300BF|nr:glycoside-pentoside-hexuronide (GPH):cation symporter [Lentilactobacillus hilgardii]MCT3399989.1 MFS transporter [Lentilactobacillus hilgardii]
MKREVKTSMAYGIGAFGHNSFYTYLNTYFIMFVTSVLFSGTNHAYATKMVAIITIILTIIRILELFLDPMFGGIIDSTRSKWGKYRPWILFASITSSVLAVVLYTNLGGLAITNGMIYLISFTILYAVMYLIYSIKDISFWGLLPAISFDSRKRGIIATVAQLGSTFGGQLLAIAYAPLLLLFSGSPTFNLNGWLGLTITIAVVQIVGGFIVSFGTQESQSAITQRAERVHLSSIFKTLIKNDQLLWMSLSYLIYALGTSATNNLLLYFFKYVLNAEKSWSFMGVVGLVTGIISLGSYPLLSALLDRRRIMIVSMSVIVLSYVMFIFDHSVIFTLIIYGIYSLALPLVFMVLILTIADSVEYGQLKVGKRSEAATTAVRPMLDKFAGAVATLVTGVVAAVARMTGKASANSVSGHSILLFNIFAFYIPLVLVLVGLLIYTKKVTLSEKVHRDIIIKLQDGLSQDKISKKNE